MAIRHLLILSLFLIFLPTVAASGSPNVTLVLPTDGNISTSNNITFICDVKDDENVFTISLYNNISGIFGLYNKKRIMELEKDSNTMLLCHFNNTYACEGGEVGTNTSTDFVSGKFMQGVRINDSDTLVYPTSNNIGYDQGTIEFWLQLGFEPNVTDARLFSTGSSNQNEIQIYVSDGNLTFEFYDNAYLAKASKNISTWNENEWHHVTGIWDYFNLVGSGEMLDIFLDGSNESVTYQSDHYGYGSFGSYMYLGSYADGTKQANSTFDELRISDKTRSPFEINASYVKGTGNHTNESVNWTMTNIPDGIYKWNCLSYDNESQGSWNDTNHTLYVDTSPPAVNNITYSPNSTDDVDPEMTINMTSNVTDLINISSVILQWKETGEWINETMDYNDSTGLYENVSITFEQTGGTYYYRIWSNDTLGHSNQSDTYNITVEWDYTWNRTPSDFGTAYGIVGCSNCYVGTLVINNTGDDTLSFLMTDNWPLSINYNVSNPFPLDPKNVIYINVTAEFSNEDSEYDITINMTASHGTETPVPPYQIVNVALNSYSGGPYFDSDDITISSPASVYQGMSYNLSAKLKNIGNESAAGVWINWSLPSGWTNTSGNLTRYIGNLNGTVDGGNIAFNNITVYLTPSSATAGIHSIYANTSSDDNLTSNSSSVVYVFCNSDDDVCGAGCNYFSDYDCPQPSGGAAPATLTALAATEAKMSVEAPERFELNRDESGSFIVYVYNTAVGTIIKNIILQVSGYPQVHMRTTPDLIDSLNYNEKKPFSVEISVPEYMTYGEHEMILEARGTYANKTIQADAKIIFFVHSITANETMETLRGAEENIQNMINMNLNTEHLNSLLEQAKTALGDWDYDKAEEMGNEIVRISEIAFRVNNMIRDIEMSIDQAESYGMSVPETRKMYSLSIAAFQRGDYERAEERAESALLTHSIETHGLVGILNFLYGYWWALIVIITVLIVAFWRMHRVIIIRSISGKLKRIDLEEKEMLGMIKDYQKRYWQDKSISAEDYQGSLSEHENRFMEMMENRSDLTIRKIKLTADNVLQALERELGSVKRRMNDLQKKYFEGRDVSKTSYLMMMNDLNTEMLNIQKNLDIMKLGRGDTGKSGKSKLVLAVVMIIIIILLVMSPHVNALGDKDRALGAIESAEIEIQSMRELGFGTSYVNDTLNEAKLLYNQEKYLAAETLAEKVTEIKNLAIETDSLIDQVEAMLYESSNLGIDASPAQDLFNQSLEAFKIEDYIQAKDLLTQAINKLDELESEAALQKTLQKTWYTDPFYLLIPALIAIIIIVYITYTFYIRRKTGKKRLVDLQEQKKSLEELIKGLQVKYFRDSVISKSEYERLKNHYRKSLMEIERNMKLIGG